MNFPSVHQRTRPRAKVEHRRIHVLAPGMLMPVSEHEIQPPCLNATTDCEQCHQLLWTKGGQIRCGHGPENMACMRRFALTVLRHYQRRSKKPPAITEQLFQLRCNPTKVLEYLKLTGNTRPRRAQRAPGREWLIAA